MLEDPWASLQRFGESEEQDLSDYQPEQPLSDSMIPQVGDSFLSRINPAPDVSFSGDDGALAQAEDSPTTEAGDVSKGPVTPLSDSMIPQVGDSLLNRHAPDETQEICNTEQDLPEDHASEQDEVKDYVA